MKVKDVEFEIIRSKRRTLAVEVKPGGEVLVRAPKKLSEKYIIDFVSNKYVWILKSIDRQKQNKKAQTFSNEQITYLRQKAKEFIPKRVEHFSEILGLYPTGVKITSAKTRFGSCSPKNSLNFSLYLMLYPIEAIDYVVVHELAHIKHKNHSKQFYGLIETVLPDYKNRIAILKNK